MKTVTIIGLGLIGGSLSHVLKKKGITVRGVSSPKTLEKALSLGIIDAGFDYSELAQALEDSSFVFICTPLLDIEKRIPKVFEYAQKGTVISDVGSTKDEICRVARENLHRGISFVGGHPMAGSEKRGLENASPFLFYDAVWVLTPIKGTPKRAVKSLSDLLSQFGAKIMILPPELHDRIAASVSHLPQLLAVLLTNQLAQKDSDLFRNLAAGGFRDMTRIASSGYGIWRDILRTNLDGIRGVLGDFRDGLDTLLQRIDDESYLEQVFERANRERMTIPKYSKGFLKPLNDVRITVEDKPGELAKITNLIYYRAINIKDIEIVTVREGEGGVLRLGFSQKNEAENAASVLTAAGYEVMVSE
jgi:prephenate dehydrogenase